MTEQSEPKKRTGAVKKVDPNGGEKEKVESTFSRYVRETRGEMNKVTWPSRAEAQRLTAIVIGFTAAFALFLGILDFLWSQGLQALISFIVGA